MRIFPYPAHLQAEFVIVAKFLMNAAPPGPFVEAGSFKGGSAAKFSALCEVTDRKLLVFDSFEGLPPNEELHFGSVIFPGGDYAGSLEEVRSTISRLGKLDVVEFHQGWFEDTLPSFKQPIAGAYIDVDLEGSTRTCVKYLFPLISKGGAMFSQDGHPPRIVELLKAEKFWEEEVGVKRPRMDGLGQQTLIKIFKDY